MKSLLKWFLILAGAAVVVVAAAMVVVPMVVDVAKYKPKIEELVTRQTGRPFSMGDDIDLSVFPWVGVRLSDLCLGNPEGFSAGDMVSVKRFEVRLKVMPLLSRQIVVNTFVVDTPRIHLEKLKNGRANWEGMGKPDAKAKGDKSPAGSDEKSGDLPIESLLVGNFSIENGLLSYADRAAGTEKKLTGFNLNVSDISFDKPLGIQLSAMVDEKPVSLSGRIGPLGKEPGKSDITLDLALKALSVLDLTLSGSVKDPAGTPLAHLDIRLSPFSPRALLAELGQAFPVQTADPKVLDKVGFNGTLDAGPASVALSNGTLVLDDSTARFSLAAKDFAKPDLKLDLALDQMDLDRYLPPAKSKEAEPAKDQGTAKKAKPDYTALRKMVLDAAVKIGNLKASNMKIENLAAHVKGKDGVFHLKPLSMNLYQGSVAAGGTLDVQGNVPKTRVNLDVKNVQAGPLIKDAAAKEIIEGTVTAAMALSMAGDTPEAVKKTLNGKGQLDFKDGAVVGIDIADTVRSATSKVGMSKQTDRKPRTDFAELRVPFTAGNGVANITGAFMASPLMRVNAKGAAHLVKETLDFRVEPKLVATLKGQGDTKDRTGLTVPLLITGTFAQPKIRPDLKGLVSGALANPDQLKKMVDAKALPKVELPKTDTTSVQDTAKGLLKGLPGLKN